MDLRIENLVALDRLIVRFSRIRDPDAQPLMLSWGEVIRLDNQRGVMAQLDKDDNPMLPVSYRPIDPATGRRVREGLKPTQEQKNHNRTHRRAFGGFGPHAAGLHNNLTTGEYELLGGPALAPRGKYSRVITNLKTDWRRIGPTRWEAYAYWDQVVNAKGVPFLQYHFEGVRYHTWHGTRTIRRDLRGVRPEGVQAARTRARNWMMDVVRSGGTQV